MKVKRVFKYGTGQAIPDGAVYLNTVTQEWQPTQYKIVDNSWERCFLVWHYFLVEVEDK